MNYLVAIMTSVFVLSALSISAFAGKDADNINTQCATDAQTAGCTGEKVGQGLLKCLHHYKMKNPTYKFSEGCAAAVEQGKEDWQARRAKRKMGAGKTEGGANTTAPGANTTQE